LTATFPDLFWAPPPNQKNCPNSFLKILNFLLDVICQFIKYD